MPIEVLIKNIFPPKLKFNSISNGSINLADTSG